MNDYVVIRSALILTAREARRYYEERLSGVRIANCHGRQVTVVFERGANHVYTTEWAGEPPAQVIRRRLSQHRYDERVLCLDRARLMDSILPAICYFTFSLPGTGPANGANRLLHGPRLADGRYLRVVLGPGPNGRWFCRSAYPIGPDKWRELRGARTVKFPP